MENIIVNSEAESFSLEDKKQAKHAFSKILGATFMYSLFAFCLIVIAQILIGIVVGPDAMKTLSQNPYYLWGLQIGCVYLISFPLFMLMVRDVPSQKLTSEKLNIKSFAGLLCIAEFLMLFGALISQWITDLFARLLGHNIEDTTSTLINDTPLWLIILAVVIIGPIVEELIFRKVFIDKLSVYGEGLAIIVSSLAFGLFHGNFYQLFYATALGFLLGYVYSKTHNLIHSCLLHMSVNFLGTVPVMLINNNLQRLSTVTDEVALNSDYMLDLALVGVVTLLEYGMAIAGIVILVRAIKNKTIKWPGNFIKIPMKHLVEVVLLNIGTIAFLIYYIGECLLSLSN